MDDIRASVPDVFIYVLPFGSPSNPVKLLFLSSSCGNRLRALAGHVARKQRRTDSSLVLSPSGPALCLPITVESRLKMNKWSRGGESTRMGIIRRVKKKKSERCVLLFRCKIRFGPALCDPSRLVNIEQRLVNVLPSSSICIF